MLYSKKRRPLFSVKTTQLFQMFYVVLNSAVTKMTLTIKAICYVYHCMIYVEIVCRYLWLGDLVTASVQMLKKVEGYL